MKVIDDNYNVFWKICAMGCLAAFSLMILDGKFIEAGILFLTSLFCFVLTIPDEKIVACGIIYSPLYKESNGVYFWTLTYNILGISPKYTLIHLREVTGDIADEIEELFALKGFGWTFNIKGKIVLKFKIPDSFPIENPFYQNEKDFKEIWDGISMDSKQSFPMIDADPKILLSIRVKEFSIFNRSSETIATFRSL